jgi:hypothetical protein
MGNGQWAMGNGQWAMGNGQQTFDQFRQYVKAILFDLLTEHGAAPSAGVA